MTNRSIREERGLFAFRESRWEGSWSEYLAANAAQATAHKTLSAWVNRSDDPTVYPRNFRDGMAMLVGPPGVGKSDIASSFFHRILKLELEESEVAPVWVHAPTLMRWLPSAGEYWHYDAVLGTLPEDPSPFFRLTTTRWLFLDDLREPQNALERQFIIDLFDARSERVFLYALSGVITTNLDAEGLRKSYGERTFDRMNDGALWIPMAGKSQRRPQSVRSEPESEVNL